MDAPVTFHFLNIKTEIMILILTDIDEPTTDLVIDWLHFYDKKFIRLSREQPVEIKRIYHANDQLECIFSFRRDNKTYEVDTIDITSYWYRRSRLRGQFKSLPGSEEENGDLALNDFLQVESLSALSVLEHIINQKKHINRYADNDIIKLVVLEYAMEVRLEVPDFVVCTDKNTLTDFYLRHNGNVITKPIGDPKSFFYHGFHTFTSKVNPEALPDSFALSLFQEMVPKFVELRIFYFNKTFYGSAIFSQSNERTKIDFKNYSDEKPNRVVPFKVPLSVSKKLEMLMEKLDLNSGSIDMILTPDDRYVFLEVNPVGQFEQVSYPCQYNLFKTIAETL